MTIYNSKTQQLVLSISYLCSVYIMICGKKTLVGSHFVLLDLHKQVKDSDPQMISDEQATLPHRGALSQQPAATSHSGCIRSLPSAHECHCPILSSAFGQQSRLRAFFFLLLCRLWLWRRTATPWKYPHWTEQVLLSRDLFHSAWEFSDVVQPRC